MNTVFKSVAETPKVDLCLDEGSRVSDFRDFFSQPVQSRPKWPVKCELVFYFTLKAHL